MFLRPSAAPFWRVLTAATFFYFLQIRYCTTPQRRCGLTHTSPRATTASPLLTLGSPSTTIPPLWRLPLLAPTLWVRRATMGRPQLTSCLSNSSSSSLSSRVNYNSCSRSNSFSTTTNSSFCSISNSRWLIESAAVWVLIQMRHYMLLLMRKAWVSEMVVIKYCLVK